MKTLRHFLPLQILIFTLLAVQANADLSQVGRIKQAVIAAKEQVFVFGASDESAYRSLTDTLLTQNFTSTDLLSYLTQYGSDDERAVFSEALSDRALTSEQMTVLFSRIANSKMVTGAEFRVSCGVGLGIGIPLVIAGAILTITSYREAAHSKKTQSDYQAKAQATSQAFLENNGQMKVQMNQYNSLIDVAQSQADELNRKIASGYYNSNEVATFQSQLTQLNTDIQSYRTKIGDFAVSITYSESQYNRSMNELSRAEEKDLASVDHRVSMERKIGIASAVVGVPFIFLGGADCQ